MDRIREGDRDGVRDHVAWLLSATKAYGVKVVNPGGVETWKQGRGQRRDPRRPGRALRRHAPADPHRAGPGGRSSSSLPHPIHLHGLNLGLAGERRDDAGDPPGPRRPPRPPAPTSSSTATAARADDAASLDSQVPALAEYVNTHPGLTVDVGQVLFGETTSMTADGAVGQFLHTVTGRKWVNLDVEAGDRLRRRADHVRGQELRPRPAVGDRAGMVSRASTTRGGSRSAPTTPTAARSWPTRRSSPC